MKTKSVDTAKVGVLLATYNGEQFLGDQIFSLLSQTNVDVHIFVRDDGSRDGTIELLRRLKAAHSSHITLVTGNESPSGSAATNFFTLIRSVDLARYDYVAFSDQDDIWLPTKLERAVECIRSHGGGGYSSDLLAWNAESGATYKMDKAGQEKSLDYLFQGASAGCTYVLDRSCIALVRDRLDQLQEAYCGGVSHDWVVYAICRSAGFRWFYDDDTNIRYRQHSANVYGALPGIKGVFARMRMMQTGWYKNHILWLGNVIEKHPAEMAVLAAMARGSLADRLMLVCSASNFRRKWTEVWKLRFALAFGLLR